MSHITYLAGLALAVQYLDQGPQGYKKPNWNGWYIDRDDVCWYIANGQLLQAPSNKTKNMSPWRLNPTCQKQAILRAHFPIAIK